MYLSSDTAFKGFLAGVTRTQRCRPLPVQYNVVIGCRRKQHGRYSPIDD